MLLFIEVVFKLGIFLIFITLITRIITDQLEKRYPNVLKILGFIILTSIGLVLSIGIMKGVLWLFRG